MKWPSLVPGVFHQRDNRFRATVAIGDTETWAHVPNSGRLGELFQPGTPVWLAPAGRSGRVTDYDLVLVEYAGVLVSVDARLPNALLAEAIAEGRVYPGYETIAREVRHGVSRLDLRLEGTPGTLWIECKSVTLVCNGTALFPDAPTARGRRHLEELAAIATLGERAAAMFVVQRPDAQRLRPYHKNDAAFAKALVRAHRAGVQVRAFTCDVTRLHIRIAREIPIHLCAPHG